MSLLDRQFKDEPQSLPPLAYEAAVPLEIDVDKKADVLVSLMETFHGNVSSWTTRSFEAVVWATGIAFAAASYIALYPEKVTIAARVVAGVGLSMLGIMLQLYLRAAERAHYGNRLGIAKCEAALGLYAEGTYLPSHAMFKYSQTMLESHSLRVVALLHALASVACVLAVALGELIK